MRLPIVPMLIAATLLSAVVYLFNATSNSNRRTLDAPRLTRLADIEGTETEVAIAPDGSRYAVIVDADLWILNASDSSRRQLTRTPEAESFPSWTPDGRRIAFTRGDDTYVLNADGSGDAQRFKADAVDLSWAPAGRIVFVRNRALWLADAEGTNEKQIVEADLNPNFTIHSPRFAPNSVDIAFIKSLLNLTGQVWTVNASNGMARAVVADRPAEDPLDVGWIVEGQQLVYLTNRSGVYALWNVNFADNTITPLTQPLFAVPLERVGMSIWKDRIVLPRHFVDSNIVISDGKTVAGTENLEFEPAAAPNGMMVVYTLEKDSKFEIWTSGIDGSNATFRAIGREGRFTADGFHLLYTHTDLEGNDDIWKLDIRNGNTEPVTDADEIDITPDASPDGQWIAFTSARGVAPSLWIVPASGGKRLRINDGGYAPRFSPDSHSILFWSKQALWTMAVDGGRIRSVFSALPKPTVGVWTKYGPAFYSHGEIRGPHDVTLYGPDRAIWPRFDVLPDGRWLIAPIAIRETGLWAVDLVYKTP
jgi:Tol biopolymer transport system component